MNARILTQIMSSLMALVVLLTISSPLGYADGLQKSETLCYRSFIYKNRTHPVDSKRKLDGEGLRFVLKNHSPSEELLNDYQKHTKTSRWPAYVGSLGLLTMLTGIVLSTWVIKTDLGKKDTRKVLALSGGSLALGSYFYGQLAMNNNEKTLEHAVKIYNSSAIEKEQIKVHFNPLPTGQGGEIKTEVPF